MNSCSSVNMFKSIFQRSAYIPMEGVAFEPSTLCLGLGGRDWGLGVDGATQALRLQGRGCHAPRAAVASPGPEVGLKTLGSFGFGFRPGFGGFPPTWTKSRTVWTRGFVWQKRQMRKAQANLCCEVSMLPSYVIAGCVSASSR